MRTSWLFCSGILAGLLTVSACGNSTSTPAAVPQYVDDGSSDCDPLMPDACTLPWPSNLYLKPDAARKTGYTLTFGKTSLPRNSGGTQTTPEPYAVMDGYNLGTHVLTIWPNLDVTGLADENDLGPSMQAGSAILWFEVQADGKTLKQIPHFNELDLQPVKDKNTENPDLVHRVLFTRAGVTLHENTRYIIAMRNLKDTTGKVYEPSAAFKALVAGNTHGSSLEARQPRFDDTFALLSAQGIDKSTLQLAWDFNTASHEALHGRMLEMRDAALAAVGDKGPEITVTEVIPPRADHANEVQYLAAEITGTFKAPDYMEKYDGPNGLPMYRFHLDKDGKLLQNGWRDAKFWLRIPKSALNGANPMELVEYGHGLDGAGDEIHQGWEPEHSDKRHLVYFACNMIGMSEDDEAGILMMLNNFNFWPSLPQRVTAGVVEYTLLQLAMRERIESLDWVKTNGVKFVKDANGKIPVYYSGNSQGGIYGQVVLAVSPFVKYGHLGQAGINYSTLLHRSVDFSDPFFPILKGVWPSVTDQAILLSMIQVLWDTVDPQTYVHHLSEDPFPGTQAHAALIVTHPGDFQVSPMTEQINARSDNGVKLMKNYGKAVWGATETDYPYKGSGLVSISFGNAWAQPGNWPPGPLFGDKCSTTSDCPKWPSYNACKSKALDKSGEDCKADADCVDPFAQLPVACVSGKCDATTYCMVDDPHDRAHGLNAHNDQMLWFFHNGEIKDFCGGDGCNPE
jgi:hypothetical protein